MSNSPSPEPTLWEMGAPDWSQHWATREVTYESAEAWVGRYHYLGKSPAGAAMRIGVFAPDMVGCVIYAQATNAHGVAKKYGLEKFKGNIEIARVAVHPDAPSNSTSKCVAAANAHLHAVTALEWVFSYADTGQGHHGGIYQALGAVYVGLSDARHGFLLDGEPIHPRSVVARYGTQAMKNNEAVTIAAARGERLEYVEDLNTAKHIYLLPIGNKASVRAIRKALAPFAQPYPKRVDGITTEAVETTDEIVPPISLDPLDVVIADYVARGIWPYE
jgi:hypothetical protein